jgi:hypothetical protein
MRAKLQNSNSTAAADGSTNTSLSDQTALQKVQLRKG